MHFPSQPRNLTDWVSEGVNDCLHTSFNAFCPPNFLQVKTAFGMNGAARASAYQCIMSARSKLSVHNVSSLKAQFS